MTEEQPMIRWELDALRTEYNQHWSHFRHAIDKSYQAFNIHMVMIALLFSAVSLANDQSSGAISVPLFLVIGVVAFVSSIGTISTLVTQRAGYVWNQKIIDVLRERISKKTSDVLEPEVRMFYDRRIFQPGTAWFGRINFVILAGSSVVILCAYLILRDPIVADLGFVLDGTSSLLLAIAVFILSTQKLYHSVIRRSINQSWRIHCQLQEYEKPPSECRDIKYLKKYTLYLLVTEIAIVLASALLIPTAVLFLPAVAIGLIILTLTLLCWLKLNKGVQC